MKQYFLLRSNRESGPFTLKELKAKGLFSADLLWIEGESNCWKHPQEIHELSDSLREAEVKQMPVLRAMAKVNKEPALLIQSANVERHYASADQTEKNTETESRDEVVHMPSFKELQEKYSEKFGPKKTAKSQINIGANLFGFVVLALGVTIIYVVVKNTVINFNYNSPVLASETKTEKLPQSATVHAAHNPAKSLPDNNIGTIATREPKPAKPDEQKKKNLTDVTALHKKNASPVNKEMKAVVNVPLVPLENSATEELKTEEKPEAPSPKLALQVSANDYSVGLFGGISNLELSVTNPSTQAVERAVIEIEYLKNNGKIVGSKTVEVSGLSAGATKNVSVPDNSRGMQVRYHVVNK